MVQGESFPETWTPGETSSESSCGEPPPRYFVGVEDDTTAGFGVTHGPFKELREALDIFPDIPDLSKARVVLAGGPNDDCVLYRWDEGVGCWKRTMDAGTNALADRLHASLDELGAKQEGLKALGSGTSEFGEELRGTREIRENQLETFDNPHPGRRFVISILAPELFTRCPKTGYPDFGRVYLVYVPDERCIELKSWKLFLNRFADEKHFHEDLTGRVFKSLCILLDPLWIRVWIDFNPRGNVSTRVAFEQSKLPKEEIPWQLIKDTPPVRL